MVLKCLYINRVTPKTVGALSHNQIYFVCFNKVVPQNLALNTDTLTLSCMKASRNCSCRCICWKQRQKLVEKLPISNRQLERKWFHNKYSFLCSKLVNNYHVSHNYQIVAEICYTLSVKVITINLLLLYYMYHLNCYCKSSKLMPGAFFMPVTVKVAFLVQVTPKSYCLHAELFAQARAGWRTKEAENVFLHIWEAVSGSSVGV